MTKIDNAIKEIEDFLQFNNVKEISFPEVTRIMANHKIPVEKEEMEKITDILEKTESTILTILMKQTRESLTRGQENILD